MYRLGIFVKEFREYKSDTINGITSFTGGEDHVIILVLLREPGGTTCLEESDSQSPLWSMSSFTLIYLRNEVTVRISRIISIFSVHGQYPFLDFP